jgi:flagellar export protein FliJ
MAFRFSLETVLRIRKSFVRLEHLRLLALAAVVEHVRRELESHDRESEKAVQNAQRDLLIGSVAAELQFESVRRAIRLQQRLAFENRLVELGHLHRKQQLILLAAQKKRDILENLRSRKLAAYHREQVRREQQRIDELFVARLFSKPVE